MFTTALARFASETPAASPPDAALEAARDGLVDTMGCALAGSLEEVGRIAARHAGENGASGPAIVWSTDIRTSPADAAFANGVAAHALDFDDSHPSVRGHASASLVPTVLALGEARGSSGLEVLAAYAVGIEIAGKIGRAFGHGLVRGGRHPTAFAGALASTAAAARLCGLDAAATRRAFGIAGSGVSGLMRNFGTMTKPWHAGHAARSGIIAAWMAGAGLTSDETLFDGPGGILETYGAEGEAPEALAADLGTHWEIVEPGNYVKRWPCCYSNHRPVGALMALIDEHGITADEVERITVAFLPSGDAALVSRQPRTGLEGKFSIEYCVAALLLDRALTLESFADEAVMRPQAQALVARVARRTIPDANNYTGLEGYNVVEVETKRGRFERREDRTPGSLAWPATPQDRQAKFTDCAARVLGHDRAMRLFEIAFHARALADSGEISRAATQQASGQSRRHTGG